MAAGGDRADVPDRRLLGIQICGADQKQPALLYSRAIASIIDASKKRDIRVSKRRRVGKRITKNPAQEAPAYQDVAFRDRRVNLAKLPIVRGPEECERRNQGPCAHPVTMSNSGDRPLPSIRPGGLTRRPRRPRRRKWREIGWRAAALPGGSPIACLCRSKACAPSAMISSRCSRGKKRAFVRPSGWALAVLAGGTDGNRPSDAQPAAKRTDSATTNAVAKTDRKPKGTLREKSTVIRRLMTFLRRVT